MARTSRALSRALPLDPSPAAQRPGLPLGQWRFGRILVAAIAIEALSGATVTAPPSAAAARETNAIAISEDDSLVFVANPDSDTIGKIDAAGKILVAELAVGDYPRQVALAEGPSGNFLYTAGQNDHTIWRVSFDGTDSIHAALPAGCGPYGVLTDPPNDRVYVSCQHAGSIVVLDGALSTLAAIPLDWPQPRAMALSDAGHLYVTHYLTIEPNDDAHVTEIATATNAVTRVLAIPPDETTCETQNGGPGVLNLVTSIAVVPAGAPDAVAGQLWVGGTQQNNRTKGLFLRSRHFIGQAGAELFPDAPFLEDPPNQSPLAFSRNLYKASFHDITRHAIWKIDLATGTVAGKIDIDEAANANQLVFSPDGGRAYNVDLTFNSYHVFDTARGQDGNPTTIFGNPNRFGPGGGDPSVACSGAPLSEQTPEGPFIIPPQAGVDTISGYDLSLKSTLDAALTGVEYTMADGQMRPVADGIGTAPIGIALTHDGQRAFVANYLSRNVVELPAAPPTDYVCAADASVACEQPSDCPSSAGSCGHPGGATCTTEADCGGDVCVRSRDCVPLVLSIIESTLIDPLPPAILDGKILFNTAARDSSVLNGVGLGAPAPSFNDHDPGFLVGPGEVTSTSHDASYVTCTTCHADFGGQDGRVWDFSQFGASLRNTMDLRGRPAFAPGTCGATSPRNGLSCQADAECGDVLPLDQAGDCTMPAALVPPNITNPADRARYFNPMLTVHWNSDRDEVEDFEFTYRSLMGAGDCDGTEHLSSKCTGALVQRAFTTDNVDVSSDLGAPNRNIPGNSGVAGARLSHMADFVYTLASFPENPNDPDDAAAVRGRDYFNDPIVGCALCHNGPAGGQQFTDKGINPGFVVGTPARADSNNPFIRHDVGTANLFDRTDPHAIAADDFDATNGTRLFQNAALPIPGSRDDLNDYVTPVLVDLWSSAPYLHDGSAPTLLSTIVPCSSDLEFCEAAGRGRNIDRRHGVTDVLTSGQMNDLAAFLRAPSTPVGTNEESEIAGPLEIEVARVVFGETSTDGKLVLVGSFRLPAGRTITPDSESFRFSVGRPVGEAMEIVASDLAAEEIKANRSGTRFKFAGGVTGGGQIKVVLRRGATATDPVEVTLKLTGIDLRGLRAADPLLTFGLEFGTDPASADTFGRTRPMRSNRANTSATFRG